MNLALSETPEDRVSCDVAHLLYTQFATILVSHLRERRHCTDGVPGSNHILRKYLSYKFYFTG